MWLPGHFGRLLHWIWAVSSFQSPDTLSEVARGFPLSGHLMWHWLPGTNKAVYCFAKLNRCWWFCQRSIRLLSFFCFKELHDGCHVMNWMCVITHWSAINMDLGCLFASSKLILLPTFNRNVQPEHEVNVWKLFVSNITPKHPENVITLSLYSTIMW